MAARSRKILLKDMAAFDVTLELQNLRHSKSKPRVSRTKKPVAEKVEEPIEPPAAEEATPPNPIPTRVFLYLQLQSIANIPKRDSKLTIKLTHKNRITKLDDHFTLSTEIDPYDMDAKPTFSITIDQDSPEDLNVFSDYPLLITVVEHKIMSARSEGNEEEVLQKDIARGTIDLLPFFTKNRSITDVETFLYPTSKEGINPEEGTCKTVWQIYSLQPLLKDITFCNIVFITLESIYNASPELLEFSEALTAELSLQPIISDEDAENASENEEEIEEENAAENVPICSFSCFTPTIIDEQDYNHKWETVASGAPSDAHTLAARSGCRTNNTKLFRELLGNEGVDYKFDEISTTDDVALVANTMRRFVLTQELSKLLEETIAFNEHQLLIEVYDRDDPDQKLLRGTVDLSIFLYPKVNACRFAVKLSKCPRRVRRDSTASSASKYQYEEIRIEEPIEEKPIFAILNICLLLPITETCGKMTLYSLKKYDPEKLKLCYEIEPEPEPKTKAQICEESYKRFDDQIGHLIDKIVQKKMNSVEDAKGLLCCHKDELINKITKLISCDFNFRFPTQTNEKFSDLMTIVYKELVQRIYDRLYNCNNWARQCSMPNEQIEEKVRMFMTISKMLNEVGDTEWASFFLEKSKTFNTNDTSINFYEFLYNVEKQHFESAKLYLSRPLKERHSSGEYFTALIAIYIDYVTILEAEQYFNESLQYLLHALEKFSNNHPKEIAVWILLHCLYKSCGYQPGIMFTRWKYENLPATPYIELPLLPISLWEMYNSYDLNLQSPTGVKYYNAIKLFLTLGIYKFAKIVYDSIVDQCNEPEKYLMTTTFHILLNSLPKKYAVRVFTGRENPSLDKELIGGFQAFINGHLQYHRGETEMAMSCYKNLLKPSRTPMGRFQLGLMRYAYRMARSGQDLKAIVAFQACNATEIYSLIVNFHLGKAMYNLNRLQEAEQHFAKCTMHGMHIPDVWAYLALVNIKMKNTMKALESWKYAKVNPHNKISNEILDELRAINHDDLSTYVDNCGL